MLFSASLALFASLGWALPEAAQYGKPAPPSLCDKYTTALLKENTAANQQTVLTLVVNTVIIGNYTKPNVGIAVPGILAPGTGDFKGVNLAPYFTGALKSSNRGGKKGVAVNFLDGGGAEPLKANMLPKDVNSAQYRLQKNLYSYFAGLLGCSKFGVTTGKYTGSTSMFETHKFMALGTKEFGWFLTNVGLSAASFGVTKEDVGTVATALSNAFGMRCSAPVSIPASAQPAPQSICIQLNCPKAKGGKCPTYAMY